MTGPKAGGRIRDILAALDRELEALAEAGKDIPAVERNAARMRGTLRTLQIQFEDLPPVAAAPTRDP